MNKTLTRLLLLLSGISAAAFLLLYPSLPDRVPINYNWQGVVDAWGSKAEYIWLQLMPFGIAVLFWALPKIDPRRKNYQHHSKAYSIISVSVVVMLLLFNWAMLSPLLGFNLPVGSIITLTLGVSFVVLGNYMPQIRPNFFMGIKTPWALSSDAVWRKTHRFGGVVFCIGGILFILGSLIPGGGVVSILGMGVLCLGSLGAMVYSFVLFQKERKNQKEEDGTNAEN